MVRTAPNATAQALTRTETFATDRAHEVWRRLRRSAPVSWTPPAQRSDGRDFPGFWNITKYDDVLTISRDPATFISGRGITMGTTPETAGPGVGLGKMLIVTDPPRHVRLRRLVNKGFTPRAVAAFEPQVRAITTRILDEIAERGAGDFVTDVAARLPLAVICEMMGVPEADWPLMFALTNKLVGGADPEYRRDGESAYDATAGGHRQMFAYFAGQLAERRRAWRDDLVSVLVGSDIDGDTLSDEEILYFCSMLIVAGNETTRNAITGGLLALIDHPEQRERLRHAPDVLSSAVEEMLRWVSPVIHMARTATRDTVIRGTPIAAGERVVMWYPSVNRDEDVFPDGDVFDITRRPNEHLAFGIGEHFCLGAGFARLEMRVIFEQLLQRFPDIKQTGPPQRLRSAFIGGIKHLPVRYTPA